MSIKQDNNTRHQGRREAPNAAIVINPPQTGEKKDKPKVDVVIAEKEGASVVSKSPGIVTDFGDLDKLVSDAPIIMKQEEKKVKIRPAKDHKCIIGGEHYSFSKDKIVSVPPHVKEILGNSSLGLLKPL